MDLGHPDVEYFTGLQNIWETHFVLESEYSEHLGDAVTTGEILADAAGLQVHVSLQTKMRVLHLYKRTWVFSSTMDRGV